MRFFLLTLAFVLTTCSDPAPSTISAPAAAPHGPGIYYWKTSWSLPPLEQDALAKAGTKQLFVRLFDIDYDFNREEARPKGLLKLPDSLGVQHDFTLVPVVYIVERVFRQNIEVEELARRTARTIRGIAAGHPGLSSASRWQIDCDWTVVSRDRYFAFLEDLQQQNPDLTLSVTVRLHQYRERIENGIPPVPEGLLMCYNMEPVSDAGSTNAIYQEKLLRGYLKAPPYPIPLDAALPVFSWGAAFRDSHFLGITDEPFSLPGLQQEIAPSRFIILKDTTINGTFLRAGDNLRYDGPGDLAKLRAAAQLLKQKTEVRDLLLFDWQEGLTNKYPPGEIWKEFYR
ncbi:hypothetical protein FUA23_12015 [Neolewinella aurantiaca]|uniref:Uncharacterized protein n=1 Tax=Neolewinella aurantiaca TaxID=2602767 RepID=A0A5C7FFG6_9BACT|nr:hypothetical protein [Neolewinella aurantiaca]TXF89008.1 hypothetical protein FUA23_12015 [Neolewinella aurantiaca]